MGTKISGLPAASTLDGTETVPLVQGGATKKATTAQLLADHILLVVGDETTAITSGTAKLTFRMPYAFTLSAVRATLSTAQASGALLTVDVKMGGVSLFSTLLTVDNTEKTTTTAATPAVLTTTALTDDAEITIDVTQVGNGSAKGLKVCLLGRKT